MKLTVIIPALDEAEGILQTLQSLQPMRRRGHEVILVDGGSRDATVDIAGPLVDRLIRTAAGRARQMNAGAAHAGGDLFWFLHADTRVPAGSDGLIVSVLGRTGGWGRFDVRLSGNPRLLRVVERFMNARSRLTGIATGDQGLFVTRQLFEAVGGYSDMPLMEDIDMSKRLKRRTRPVCLRQTLVTSSRRWERRGVLRTVFLMWYLRLAYFAGIPAERLATLYR